MADTKHESPAIPVEGDGVSYAGIGWFVLILTVVTVICQVLMWGLFAALESRVDAGDTPRSALAVPQGQAPPGPNLIAMLPQQHGEPSVLQEFRAKEETTLTTYGWADQNAGLVRIPIERAKEILLERGFPTREKGK